MEKQVQKHGGYQCVTSRQLGENVRLGTFLKLDASPFDGEATLTNEQPDERLHASMFTIEVSTKHRDSFRYAIPSMVGSTSLCVCNRTTCI